MKHHILEWIYDHLGGIVICLSIFFGFALLVFIIQGFTIAALRTIGLIFLTFFCIFAFIMLWVGVYFLVNNILFNALNKEEKKNN